MPFDASLWGRVILTRPLVSFIGFSLLLVVEASPREVSWYCFG